MPGLDDPDTLRRLAAFGELVDESFLVVAETHVARSVLEGVNRRIVRRGLKGKPNAEMERRILEARREIAEQMRYLEQVLVTEVANWRFLSEQRQQALEEVLLWRPVTRPSGSKRLFRSRTATTTGSSST